MIFRRHTVLKIAFNKLLNCFLRSFGIGSIGRSIGEMGSETVRERWWLRAGSDWTTIRLDEVQRTLDGSLNTPMSLGTQIRRNTE